MPRGVGTSVRQDCFVYSDNVAATDDGGRTWTLAGRPSFPGAVYGAAWMPGAPTPTLVAVGPNGIAYSAIGASPSPAAAAAGPSVRKGG